jgi:hypothetical protein
MTTVGSELRWGQERWDRQTGCGGRCGFEQIAPSKQVVFWMHIESSRDA